MGVVGHMTPVNGRRAEDRRVLVIGSDAVGVRVAEALPVEPTFVGFDERTVERVGNAASESVVVDTERFDVPADEYDTALVTTAEDSLNLLYAQRLRVDNGVSDVVVRVSDPQYHDAFAALGADTVCATSAVSDMLCDTHARYTV
jgi:Trk K+ transport system NAD-binding subunit